MYSSSFYFIGNFSIETLILIAILSCSGMSLLDPHYFAGLSISSLASVDADGDIDPLSHDQVTIHSDGMYESSASYFDKVQEESYIGRYVGR
jgi:hypothetical protein